MVNFNLDKGLVRQVRENGGNPSKITELAMIKFLRKLGVDFTPMPKDLSDPRDASASVLEI